jgi:hypothetical protein
MLGLVEGPRLEYDISFVSLYNINLEDCYVPCNVFYISTLNDS